jgi:hypothetical protein
LAAKEKNDAANQQGTKRKKASQKNSPLMENQNCIYRRYSIAER